MPTVTIIRATIIGANPNAILVILLCSPFLLLEWESAPGSDEAILSIYKKQNSDVHYSGEDPYYVNPYV
jgi:hypothetical protein